jgi:hypothetical protein
LGGQARTSSSRLLDRRANILSSCRGLLNLLLLSAK